MIPEMFQNLQYFLSIGMLIVYIICALTQNYNFSFLLPQLKNQSNS
jgi:hypothetical protein